MKFLILVLDFALIWPLSWHIVLLKNSKDSPAHWFLSWALRMHVLQGLPKLYICFGSVGKVNAITSSCLYYTGSREPQLLSLHLAYIGIWNTGVAHISPGTRLIPSPGSLPRVQGKGVKIERPVPWNYYQNVVTSSCESFLALNICFHNLCLIPNLFISWFLQCQPPCPL
jgi:hypothetical protein